MRKVPALVTATLALALVASASASGCSSSTSTPAGPDGGDASAPPSEAGLDANVDVDAGPKGCPLTVPIDATQFPWKPPSRAPGACTQGDLDAFVSFVTANPDPAKWKASITSAACQGCVFGRDGVTWPPIVENDKGRVTTLNIGGCIAIASGKEACGRAFQQWRDCYYAACNGCPESDPGAFKTCVDAANKGACAVAFDAVNPACGDAQAAYDAQKVCDAPKFAFEGAIRAQCIGLPDAGP